MNLVWRLILVIVALIAFTTAGVLVFSLFARFIAHA
jgi:hypothetical protein